MSNGAAFASFVRQKLTAHGWTSLGKVDGVTLAAWYDLFQETLPASVLGGIPTGSDLKSELETGAAPKGNFGGKAPASVFQEVNRAATQPAPVAPVVEGAGATFKLTSERAPRKLRADQALFAEIAGVCGYQLTEITPQMRGAINKAVQGLMDVGATPQEVRRRGILMGRQYGADKVTPGSLAKNWAAFSPKNAQVVPMATSAYLEPSNWQDCGLLGLPDEDWFRSARTLAWERLPEPWKRRIVAECQQAQDREAQG